MIELESIAIETTFPNKSHNKSKVSVALSKVSDAAMVNLL
mgnify:CR=1 FL=1